MIVVSLHDYMGLPDEVSQDVGLSTIPTATRPAADQVQDPRGSVEEVRLHPKAGQIRAFGRSMKTKAFRNQEIYMEEAVLSPDHVSSQTQRIQHIVSELKVCLSPFSLALPEAIPEKL